MDTQQHHKPCWYSVAL